MAKKKTNKTESRSKNIGAKPIPNNEEVAQNPMEKYSAGINTKYDALGGYSGRSRFESRLARMNEYNTPQKLGA